MLLGYKKRPLGKPRGASDYSGFVADTPFSVPKQIIVSSENYLRAA